MRQIIDIARKDLLLLSRDKPALFWTLGFPLLMATFFGSIFSNAGGGVRGIEVIIVDEDGTPSSSKFVELLLDSKGIEAAEPEDDPREAVRKGRATAFVLLPAGYEAGLFSFEEDRPAVRVGIDPSRRAEGGLLQGLLNQTSFRVLVERFQEPGWMRGKVALGLEEVTGDDSLSPLMRTALSTLLTAVDDFYVVDAAFDDAEGQEDRADVGLEAIAPKIEFEDLNRDRSGEPASSYEVSWPQALLWALMACCASFAVSLVLESTRGTLQRVRTAPISLAQLLAGKGLACFTTCLLSTAVILGVGTLPFFGVRLAHPTQLAMAIIASALCFTGLMQLISVMGRTEESVAGAGWGILMILAMFGGAMVPRIAMPEWMDTVSQVSPVSWAIIAYEGAIWRDFSVAEMLPPCAVLLGIGAAGFWLGTHILTRRLAAN